MKVLVANLGSTSFKYRLFDMSDPAEPLLARGGIERIGSPTRQGRRSSRREAIASWSARSPITVKPSSFASTS